MEDQAPAFTPPDAAPGNAPPAAEAAKTAAKAALTAETMPLCVQMLQQLRAGLSQALLYTLDSKQFEKAAENCFAPLQALLSAIGSFNLNMAGGEALISGQRAELPPSKRIVIESIDKVLTASGINSLRFEAGLTQDELAQFLQLLARKQLGGGDGAKINQFLRERNVAHVFAGELRYVAISSQEKVVALDEPGLSHAAAQGAVGAATDRCVRTLKRMEDPVAREQLRAELIEQLLEHDPELLNVLLATASQCLKRGESDTRGALLALPQRDAALFESTLAMVRVLAGEGAFQSEEAVRALKALIAAQFAPYRSRAEEILGRVPFEPEVLQLLPAWLVQANSCMQAGSALERLDGILAQSPGALLDEKMFARIVDVLDELSVAGMDAEAQRLAGHVAGALGVVVKSERAKAVERISFLLDRSLEQVSHAVQILENALLEACTHETTDEVMRLLLVHLGKRCKHHYKLGNFEQALDHLRWIASLEEGSRVALRDEGANLARRTREELAKSEFAAQIAADLSVPEEARRQAAQEMTRQLGREMWPALFERIRTETDADVLAALAEFVKTLGAESVPQLTAYLSRQSDPASAMRLLMLGPGLGDDAAFHAHLPALLRHADEKVRQRALQVILHAKDAWCPQIVLAAVHDEPGLERRRVLLQAMARAAGPASGPALAAEIEHTFSAGASEEPYLTVLLEVARGTECQECVPVLCKILTPHASGSVLRGADGEPGCGKTAVVAAVRALARYFEQTDVSGVFEALRNEKDTELARLAVVAQRGILAAEQQQQDLIRPPVEPAGQPGLPLKAPPSGANAQTASLRRKTHRVFESLEAQVQAENVFRMATGGAPIPPAVPVALAASVVPVGVPAAGKSGLTKVAGSSPAIPAPVPAAAPPPAVSAPAAPQPPQPQPQPAARPPSQAAFAPPAFVFPERDTAMAAPSGSGLHVSHPATRAWLRSAKPAVEGFLQDLGLAATLMMVGSREGVLKVSGPGADALAFIKGRKVVHVSYLAKTDLAALLDMDDLQAAHFAFYLKPVGANQMTCAFDIANLKAMLQRLRSQRGS